MFQFPPLKLFCAAAAMAVMLIPAHADAGTPDRKATALWGPSAMVWVTEKPVNAAPSAMTQSAAPHAAMHGEQISGPDHGKSRWCAKKKHCSKAMHNAYVQAQETNAPLQTRMQGLQHELHTIWTAPSFDRDAFLKKRAEMRDVHNQMAGNIDAAAATAAAGMSAAQRAQVKPCWFHKNKQWCAKKLCAKKGKRVWKKHPVSNAAPAQPTEKK